MMGSKSQYPVSDLQLEYILSEFYDHETVRFVENRTGCITGNLSLISSLHDAIVDGNWSVARSGISKLALGDRATVLLNEQIAKEMLWEQGLSKDTLDFIQNNIQDTQIITNLASLLFIDSKQPPRNHRQSLSREILYNPTFGARIQELLDSALAFESIAVNGKVTHRKRADVQSFVYADLYLRILHDSCEISCMKRLEVLCSRVSIANEFNTELISKNLGALLHKCMQKSSLETIMLLQNSPRFSKSVQDVLHWNPLLSLAAIKIRPNFDYLQEYESRRSGSLPTVFSILELGCVIQTILDPNAVSTPQHVQITEGLYKPLSEFPLVPKLKVNLGYPIWSLSCNQNGDHIVAGTSPFGSVFIYTRSREKEWVFKESINGIRAAEQLKFSPSNDRLLISRGGAITGTAISPELECFSSIPQPSSDTYGDVCWHPYDEDYYFTTRDSEMRLNMYHYSKQSLVARWNLRYYPLAIASSGDHIVVLTGKVADKPQHLLLVNFKTSEVNDVELPLLQRDGLYTTLQCSQWDPRTIMVLGSPNCIFLIDKLGIRKTRVIYGTKPKKCLLKARFGGPMDKFIITSSEAANPPRGMVFNRFTGELVTTLDGHGDLVNDVEWVPPMSPDSLPCLVTASDDNSFIVHAHTSL